MIPLVEDVSLMPFQRTQVLLDHRKDLLDDQRQKILLTAQELKMTPWLHYTFEPVPGQQHLILCVLFEQQ